MRTPAGLRCAPMAAALLALLPACNTDYPNPFEATSRPAALPVGAGLLFSSNSHDVSAGPLHELFAVEDSGAAMTRLTFCNRDVSRCDNLEAAPAPDGMRMLVRRVIEDANGDGRITPADGEAIFFADLSRRVEAGLLPGTVRASGVDWATIGDAIVFSGAGEGGLDDLFVMEPNGQSRRNLTLSAQVHERRPRIDPTGSVALFERIDATGKGQVFVFQSTLAQLRVTAGGTTGPPLPGTPYVVGSDADPDYSPDGRSVVFRRLADVGDGRRGQWDLYTARVDGSGLTLLEGGGTYRGAPDWGPRGIVFGEVDLAAGVTRLVVVQPDGSGRRVLVTLGSRFDIAFPRWLP